MQSSYDVKNVLPNTKTSTFKVDVQKTDQVTLTVDSNFLLEIV